MANGTVTDDDMTRILYAYNPWWQQKPVPQSRLKPFKRYEHAKLAEWIRGEPITAIIGARRVGKTTLLYQIIDMLLEQQCKADPASILFVPMDDPYLFMSQENFEKMLNVYAARILRNDGLDSLVEEQRAYIILDEIQGLKNWQGILKRWFDIGYNVKFVITGSSSAGILDGSAESLTGRITYSVVHPMSFSEYARFKKQGVLAEPLKKVAAGMSRLLQNASRAEDPRALYDGLVLAKNELLPHENAIRALLDEYMIKGGYPENVPIDDMTACADNLSAYLSLTIYKDVMRISGARDPVALESLFAIIAGGSSSV
ncbi:MAG: AAA family ATPase [Desulfovibrionales bacterium]|nr:AAA family ATPase [Desulfovibrionales bacterium]